VPAATSAASPVLSSVPSFGLWPSRWPVPAQVLLALALADLGSYATHVACHRVRWLWPIHAVHHAAPRLYWLNSARMHPLDSGVTVLFSLFPLALLGVPAPVLVLFDAVVVVHVMLQHANVRIRLGALNHVVAGPEFHRWHHSPLRAEGEANYATFFALWDHLFGTFVLPRGRSAPEVVGLYDGQTMAPDWVSQVLYPWRQWRHGPRRGAAPRPS
jgi:sterol desaturase/sphingolipid hydroxylase (fatty acid hydroxylase superfamily)